MDLALTNMECNGCLTVRVRSRIFVLVGWNDVFSEEKVSNLGAD